MAIRLGPGPMPAAPEDADRQARTALFGAMLRRALGEEYPRAGRRDAIPGRAGRGARAAAGHGPGEWEWDREWAWAPARTARRHGLFRAAGAVARRPGAPARRHAGHVRFAPARFRREPAVPAAREPRGAACRRRARVAARGALGDAAAQHPGRRRRGAGPRHPEAAAAGGRARGGAPRRARLQHDAVAPRALHRRPHAHLRGHVPRPQDADHAAAPARRAARRSRPCAPSSRADLAEMESMVGSTLDFLRGLESAEAPEAHRHGGAAGEPAGGLLRGRREGERRGGRAAPLPRRAPRRSSAASPTWSRTPSSTAARRR